MIPDKALVSDKKQVWSCLLAAGCALLALYGLTFPLQDPDTFWHLAYGRAMVEQGRFINHEIFSYTASGVYLGSHSQLAQVLLYLVWLGGGTKALLGVKLLVGAATFWIVLRTARLCALGWGGAASLALLVVMCGMSRFVERPELFSILFQAALILLLCGYCLGVYGVRALWAMPPVMVAWDYLHGALFGLIILLTVIGAETVKSVAASRFRLPETWSRSVLPAQKLKELWFWGVVTLLAMVLHPNGLLNYGGIWRIADKTADFSMYGEWMPPGFVAQFFWFWVCLGGAATLLVAFWRQIEPTSILLVCPFAYMALTYNRAAMAFALAAVPLMAQGGAALAERLGDKPWSRRALAALTLLLLAAVLFYKEKTVPDTFRFGSGLNETAYPVGSVRFVAATGVQGNMFNTDGAGGYLAFFGAPERKIFNYNQPGVFTALTEYVHKPASRGRWNIQYAIISLAEEYTMFKRDGFVPVYWEPNGMVLLKPGGVNDPLIEKYRIRHFEPLMSSERFDALSKNPRVAARLCEEMANYLQYRRDSRISALLGKYLHPTYVDIAPQTRREWLTVALRENPDSVPLLFSLGETVYRQGDPAGAILSFNKALALDPENLHVMLSLGYAEYDSKNFKRAAEIFRQALARDQDYADAHYGLGLAALRMQDNGLAREAFERFLQLAPQSPFAGKAKKFLSEAKRE